ncbi:hypothetical protein [Kribbella sp. NPDC003557]|uniref:hypothetical protein n=1 Tax=Kribbella sp. NPDC003557 TaxID=3154449 RepID=UPI0033BEAEDE
MSEPFPARPPITTEEREFIATVETAMRPPYLAAVAHEFGPYGRPSEEIAAQMSAAAPGERLQTAIEARMNSGRHFDALPAEERSAAAERAALAAARTLSQLTVETAEGRLGNLAGKGADHLLRGQYEEMAHAAAGQAGGVLGGAINRARFLQMAEIQRQAGAGVTPPAPGPRSAPGTTESAAMNPADRVKDTRAHGRD